MLHYDEARQEAIEAARAFLRSTPQAEKLVLIDDLFGRIRAVLWCCEPQPDAPGERSRDDIAMELATALAAAAGPYWPGMEKGGLYTAWSCSPADLQVYDLAWSEGEQDPEERTRLRIADRHRSRGAWLRPNLKPPWELERGAPPIVVFYSFKGGVGRSTALAAFAIQRARRGERVLVVDADLDAPGVGTLFAADPTGGTARWGLVDYWLERPLCTATGAAPGPDLDDFVHFCRRGAVVGDGGGEIAVVPAGDLQPAQRGDYLRKLARLDFEPPVPPEPHPLPSLLRELRKEYEPRWILIDARSGLAAAAGLWLGGWAHLHVIVGTSSEQSWRGLSLIVEHLGGGKRRSGPQRACVPQRDCVLVQALIPRSGAVSRTAREAFAERARDEFSEFYYRPGSSENADRYWTQDDLDSGDAPHVPLPLSYDEALAHYGAIDEVADLLADTREFRALGERIAERCGAKTEGEG